MTVVGAAAAIMLFALVAYVPGWAVAAALRVGGHLTRVFAGLTLTSVIGLVLAQAGRFSLTALLGILAAVTIACALVAAGRTRSAAVTTGPVRPPEGVSPPERRRATALAAVAAIATVLWTWPPYDTSIAASDSSMYVSAGAHLARTGSFAVEQTVGSMLSPELASRLFASVGYANAGPFIRLPGGLLMTSLDASAAVPAFFPLLSVWAAILALAGGAASAVLVAPLFSCLAVFAIVLFTAEAVGLTAAAIAALLLVANFAVWWFARFAMPEPLACAAIWGGLVILCRVSRDRHAGGAFLAGALFGLAGIARTETFLFLAAAVALAWAWGGLRVPLVPLVTGFVALASVTVFIGEHAPSHHLAYLRNDLILHFLALVPWLVKARASGLLLATGVLAAVLVIGAAALGRRSDVGLARGALRLVAPVAAIAALVVYARIANVTYPRRDLEWLATYCSWPLLALAVVGWPMLWRRGGDAVRVVACAWLLATAVFILNPRVAAYQPWAIRRALPLVIPGLVVAASAVLAWLAMRPRVGARLAALALVVLVAALEVRWVVPVRAMPYYAGSYALVAAIAERLPPNAIVAMDGDLADVQLQVPLWLVAGRETLMLRPGTRHWRDVMGALVASGRPIFWVGSKFDTPRALDDLRLDPIDPPLDLSIVVPDAPTDVPPSRKVTRLVPIRIYGVTIGLGEMNRRSSSMSIFLMSA